MKSQTTQEKKTKLFNVIVATLIIIFTQSCSSDGNNSNAPDTYPKEVNITYKMTGTGGPVTSGSYVNDTGGSTTFEEVPLPYVRTFTRTVNQLDDIGISFIHNNSGNENTAFTIKLEILVNNVLVKTETYNGTSGAIGSIVYLFP